VAAHAQLASPSPGDLLALVALMALVALEEQLWQLRALEHGVQLHRCSTWAEEGFGGRKACTSGGQLCQEGLSYQASPFRKRVC